ncbi:hypothetical protein RB653_004676 [Dictyostelium firmibasis]|uniref:Uncharacterized protein n=1 Tax=Dictyostelium firmibasis TaxID=79012 RepID=A0AAN7YYF4_9MYCE
MEKQTINSNYFYLLIKVNHQSITKDKLDLIVKEMITKCYGDTGIGASDTKILLFNQKDSTFILRCLKGSLSSIWTAVSLFHVYETHPCILEIIKVSPWLLPLSNPDRFSISKRSPFQNININNNNNNNNNNSDGIMIE